MLEDIILGALLTIATTAIHGLCTAGLVVLLRPIRDQHRVLRSVWPAVSLISGLVLAMFLISIFEAAMWAAVYVTVGAIESFEEALYFSLVTFTTLGYGDVTVVERWRLLASCQGAVGSIAFG